MHIDNIYLGAKTELFILQNQDKLDAKKLNDYRVHCLNFYVELATQIKSRFSFNDFLLKQLKILDPKTIFAEEEVGFLISLLNRFPILCNDDYAEHINSEWRILQECTEIKKYCSKPVLEFWEIVFTLKNDLDDLMFPHLKKFITALLCLPHSSAAHERIFFSAFYN
ncbi:hypothetical protein NQ314_016553 [Rhamnusium bicolor]|uniref:HAT C-terminal dimerisation domain-containing protein n=1 Tax=Rhamnusium bicolor TaxID=1586634 RepID=A0AAV8WVF3_9CUCU|nr:hypothetical protein NQ314_016553 [Rhamnusium bicolor]